MSVRTKVIDIRDVYRWARTRADRERQRAMQRKLDRMRIRIRGWGGAA